MDSSKVNDNTSKIDEMYYGKKVMVRTCSAGVHFGELFQKNKDQLVLKNSRRVYYWSKAATLSQLAMEGDGNIEDCKITMKVDEILLDGVIEVTPMTEKAVDILYGAKEWKV